MKIFFIGIYDDNEPNTAFRNAFRRVSTEYKELSWISCKDTDARHEEIIHYIKGWNPDIVFMQLQGANILKDETITALKGTGAFVIQWTGDARQPLPSHYAELGKKIDLSLFTNRYDVMEMRKSGCNADYLQVSADHDIYNSKGSIDIKCPEIVFMGNHYQDKFELSSYRMEMVKFLKEIYGDNFGLYGSWPNGMAAENIMFNQEKEAEVYRSCKIAINCSHYDLKSYTSDRFFRILLSGTFCLSKQFPQMEEFKPDVNFVAYDGTFVDLKDKIDYYLRNEEERKQIAANGYQKATQNWTWHNRIDELLNLINDKYKKNELDI